jgi:hypothetical protein
MYIKIKIYSLLNDLKIKDYRINEEKRKLKKHEIDDTSNDTELNIQSDYNN